MYQGRVAGIFDCSDICTACLHIVCRFGKWDTTDLLRKSKFIDQYFDLILWSRKSGRQRRLGCRVIIWLNIKYIEMLCFLNMGKDSGTGRLRGDCNIERLGSILESRNGVKRGGDSYLGERDYNVLQRSTELMP